MDRTLSVVSQSLGSLIVKIREYFEFCSDWYHRNPAVSELVGQYYVVLRSLLRQDRTLRRCLCRCRHCHIFFLTHPRNARRRDLACPFGCRRVHRRQGSNRRSRAYYRSPEGKEKNVSTISDVAFCGRHILQRVEPIADQQQEPSERDA